MVQLLGRLSLGIRAPFILIMSVPWGLWHMARSFLFVNGPCILIFRVGIDERGMQICCRRIGRKDRWKLIVAEALVESSFVLRRCIPWGWEDSAALTPTFR